MRSTSEKSRGGGGVERWWMDSRMFTPPLWENQGNRFRPLKKLPCLLQLRRMTNIRSLLKQSFARFNNNKCRLPIRKFRQAEAVWKMSGFRQSLLWVVFLVVCSVGLSLEIFLYVFTAHSRSLPPSIWPSLRGCVSPLRVWLACVLYAPSRC